MKLIVENKTLNETYFELGSRYIGDSIISAFNENATIKDALAAMDVLFRNFPDSDRLLWDEIDNFVATCTGKEKEIMDKVWF